MLNKKFFDKFNKISKIFGVEVGFKRKNGVYSPSYQKGAIKELKQEIRRKQIIKIKKQKEAKRELNNLFSKYQKPLLKLANNRFGRKFLGIETKEKIVEITDNAFVVRKKRNVYKATFRTYPVFAKKLHYALASVNILESFKKEKNYKLYANLGQYKGLLNYVGLFEQPRLFPQIFLADTYWVDNDNADGLMYHTTAAVTQAAWDTIHDAAASGGIDLTVAAMTIIARGGAGAASTLIQRGIFGFNTSAIADGATIASGDVKFYKTSTAVVNESTTDLRLLFATPANASSLVVGDYDQAGAVNNPTVQAPSKNLADITLSAYMTYALNAAGISNISKTAITAFGLRIGVDCTDTLPNGSNACIINESAAAGTDNDPKLEVTYLVSKDLSETVSIADNILKDPVAVILNEIISIVDTIEKNIGKIFSETVSLADSILRTSGKLLSETISLTDSIISKITAKILTETITIVETIVRQPARILSEVVSLASSFIHSAGRVLSEAVTITDSLIHSISKTLTEVITIVDNFTHSISKTLSETITIVDSLISQIGKALSEAITITGSFIQSFSRTLTEAVTITGSFIQSFSRTLTEAVTITGTVVKTIAKTFSESFSLIAVLWQRFKRAIPSWLKKTPASASHTKQAPTHSEWEMERGQAEN